MNLNDPAPAPASDAAPDGLSRLELGLLLWVLTCAWVVIAGYVLSLGDLLASRLGWVLAILTGAGLCLAGRRFVRLEARPAPARRPTRQAGSPRLEVLLAAGLGAVFLAGLATTLGSAPSCWDALTYHLARVGYYLQQGNLADFHANYWAQEQHSRVSALLFSATLVLTGFSDHGTGLWQLSAWVVMIAAGYGLARVHGLAPGPSRIGAGSLGLFTVAAMQAPTAQNDLLITAFLGVGALGLIGYLQTGLRLRLLYAATSLALAIGTKASAFELIPSLSLLAVATTLQAREPSGPPWRRLAILGGAILLAGLVVSAPAGYYKNWMKHGNPLGGKEVVHHIEQGDRRLTLTLVNAARYAFDFCTLDGLPETWGGDAGDRAKQRSVAALARFGVDLAARQGTRTPFAADRERIAHNDRSFFGILGPALALPALLLCWRPGRAWRFRILSAAVLLFFFVQSSMGAYDHWRGRHFLYGVCLLAPLIALWHGTASRPARAYLFGVTALGVVSAITAVLWRIPDPLVAHDGQASVFSLDRPAQMVRYDPSLPAIRRFEAEVPPTATVALALRGDEHEYALFGPNLTRRLHPVAWTLPNLALPADCDYLLFDRTLKIPQKPGDINLGYRWMLRRIAGSRPR